MNNENFFVGFVKSAMAKGYTENEAIAIYKQAAEDTDESNFMQRYNAMGSLRTSVNANHPWTGFLHKHETNKNNLDQAAADTAEGYGANAERFAGAGAQVGGVTGAGVGGLIGHDMSSHHSFAPKAAPAGGGKAKLLSTLVGLLGGAAGGAVGGAGAGALGGLAHKYTTKSTTNLASRNDALERFKQHPIRQSLIPGGDLFASMGSPKQPQQPPVNQP